MLNRHKGKYKSFLWYLQFFKYIAFAPVRGRFLESYYTLMRYLDDIVDGDAELPDGFSSEAAYMEAKLQFLQNPVHPKDEADTLMLYCFHLAEKFNSDFHDETRDILESLLFDAKRRMKRALFSQDELSRHFYLLDIRGTIRATLKIFKDDPDKYRLLTPLGTACRYQYDIEDFENDVAVGYINVPSEDCEKFGILEEHLSRLQSEPIKAWLKHHAGEGMLLLSEHHRQINGGKFSMLQKAIFKVVYEMPAKRVFKNILSRSD